LAQAGVRRTHIFFYTLDRHKAMVAAVARPLALGLAFLCLIASATGAPNPIRKVLDLMKDMQKEIEGELSKEKALFETFMCICTEYPAQLSESVETSQKTIKELNSQIEEQSAEQSKLQQDLKGHGEDKEAAEADLSKATNLREKEKTDAESSLANSKDTLQGVSQVLPILEKGAAGGASSMLLQGPIVSKLSALITASRIITPTDKDTVVSFLNSEGQSSEQYAPQSGQIVGILKQMKDDMEHSINEQEQSELVASDSYADLKGAKDEEIALAADSISTKEKHSGELSVSISTAKDSLEDTSVELDDAQKMLHTLATQCGTRKKEFESRLKLRNEEISALSEAMKVLNDDDALDVFKAAVPAASVLQTSKGGFLQTRKASSQLGKAIEIVLHASKQRKDLPMSFLLNTMSVQLRAEQHAGQAPDMSGVIKMIDGMIELLNKEQVDDETKKEWCYQEGKKADKELNTKQDALDGLKAQDEELKDRISSNAEAIAGLVESIAKLDKEVAEATELRKREHVEYADAAKLQQVAVQLLDKAKNKLQKFYNPEAYKEEKKEAAFLQMSAVHSHNSRQHKVAPIPDLPDVPELKQQNEGGVIGLMDRIKSELLRDGQEAQFNEKQAQTDYVELMDESSETRAQDSKSLVGKRSAKAELEQQLIETKEQTKTAKEELTNSQQYIADVHASCDLLLQTFNDKKEARMTELDGLKSAKQMLSNDR